MKPASLITIVVAVAAVAIAAVVTRGGGGSSSSDSPAAAEAPKGSLALDMRVSPEKEALLRPLVRQFNASGTKAGGKQVFVAMKAENSGDTEAAIAAGREQPDVWSPAGSFWGRLLNLQADKAYVADTNPSIVRTPLVIAMWEPMARVLGWPRKQISFEDILRLATAPDGWAAAGKPEYGRFKYVHTNPDSSTSGAEAVAGSYYAFVGRQEGLTEADVARAAPKVKSLERAIVHYGDSTLFIEDELCKGGLGYASAAAMEEATVIDFNRRRCSSTKLVALYPTEGSFVSDSPYIVLHAPWVSPAKAAAAAAFQRFLAKEITPEKAGAGGFRSGDETARPAGLVSPRYGADPSQPKRTLTLPTPHVVNTLLQTWRRDRKPADVELILDNSGSMADEDKLEHAKAGLQAFFKQVAPQDEIGLAKFSDKVTQLVPPAPFRENRAALQRAVRDIIPEDDTSLYDAVLFGVDTVKQRADSDHINAVVILTDGQDTHSSAGQAQVMNALRAQGQAESASVRVFTIAYGQDAQEQELERFATASGGKGFPANTGDIAAVYRSISSFFSVERRPVTRGELGRELAVNAALKPLNIAAPAVVVVVGLLLGVPVIAVGVAVLLYVVLCLQTFFDSREAERVGRTAYAQARPLRPALDASTLAPEIARPLEQARATAAAIRRAVDEADQPLDDVVAEVDGLVTAMDTSARRAQLIASTLAEGQDVRSIDRDIARRASSTDPDVQALVRDLQAQRASVVRLQDKLDRFQVGMERICASLALLRTSVAEMSASEEEAAQRDLTAQARELRERTDLLAQSMSEAFET